ncbi:5'-nucleotidase C-terminal domain-containing protein [Labilibaculum sp.]|uniref:5'-nucleotidase C-terminal domain-containing protein n=1 Tax=Labilibaculum sp. TaxID=2060723 RepID=UPI003567BAF1
MRTLLYNSLKILILLLAFSACSVSSKISKKEGHYNYAVDSLLDFYSQRDTSFLNTIESYKSQLDGEMGELISIADEPMIAHKPESKLSNYIADAMLSIGRDFCVSNGLSHSVDFAIMNIGGIRSGMPKGEINTGKLFEMLPFKNKLVILGMKGKNVLDLLNQLAQRNGEGISGVKMGIKEGSVVDVLVQGKTIDPDKVYYVISVDYLTDGGGGVSAFAHRETYRHLHKKLREEIIKYISDKYKKGEHISAELDGRIYHVE